VCGWCGDSLKGSGAKEGLRRVPGRLNMAERTFLLSSMSGALAEKGTPKTSRGGGEEEKEVKGKTRSHGF